MCGLFLILFSAALLKSCFHCIAPFCACKQPHLKSPTDILNPGGYLHPLKFSISTHFFKSFIFYFHLPLFSHYFHFSQKIKIKSQLQNISIFFTFYITSIIFYYYSKKKKKKKNYNTKSTLKTFPYKFFTFPYKFFQFYIKSIISYYYLKIKITSKTFTNTPIVSILRLTKNEIFHGCDSLMAERPVVCETIVRVIRNTGL
jgi:hypothetical protein